MSTLLPRSRRRPSCLFDELELQNEELSRSYAEYADSAQRYRELHESAPSAYLTLLRVARGALIGQPLTRLLASDPRQELERLCAAAPASDTTHMCETRLSSAGRGAERVDIHLECRRAIPPTRQVPSPMSR
jgi:hypothetical protein